MPARHSGTGVTRVHTQQLRDVAASGRKSISTFRSTLDKMEQAMNATESFWEGDAANLYRSVFRREMGELRKAFEAFAEYTSDLDGHADRYDHIDTQAQAIANGIKQAVWADV